MVMTCVDCGGRGCDRCRDGKVHLKECPRESITHNTVRTIQLAGFAERGAWPVGGGVLDQSHSFLSACELIWKDERYWKAKNGVT